MQHHQTNFQTNLAILNLPTTDNNNYTNNINNNNSNLTNVDPDLLSLPEELKSKSKDQSELEKYITIRGVLDEFRHVFEMLYPPSTYGKDVTITELEKIMESLLCLPPTTNENRMLRLHEYFIKTCDYQSHILTDYRQNIINFIFSFISSYYLKKNTPI